jgi:hypothetical protein
MNVDQKAEATFFDLIDPRVSAFIRGKQSAVFFVAFSLGGLDVLAFTSFLRPDRDHAPNSHC